MSRTQTEERIITENESPLPSRGIFAPGIPPPPPGMTVPTGSHTPNGRVRSTISSFEDRTNRGDGGGHFAGFTSHNPGASLTRSPNNGRLPAIDMNNDSDEDADKIEKDLGKEAPASPTVREAGSHLFPGTSASAALFRKRDKGKHPEKKRSTRRDGAGGGGGGGDDDNDSWPESDDEPPSGGEDPLDPTTRRNIRQIANDLTPLPIADVKVRDPDTFDGSDPE